MKDLKTLVIIPTFNEIENIGLIIDNILELYNNFLLNILVVDDKSSDGTPELVKAKINQYPGRVSILERSGKLGLGTAYIEGFKMARQNGYDIVIQMDADFSHDPKYIKELLETLKDYDMVIGSRYIQGINVVNWPMSRLLLSYCASIYIRIFCGLPLKDPTGGFKCIRTKIFDKVNLDNIGVSGYSFQIEVNFRVWKNKFAIKEIPIVFVDRVRGISKMSTGIIAEAFYLIWKLRILSFFKKI